MSDCAIAADWQCKDRLTRCSDRRAEDVVAREARLSHTAGQLTKIESLLTEDQQLMAQTEWCLVASSGVMGAEAGCAVSWTQHVQNIEPNGMY